MIHPPYYILICLPRYLKSCIALTRAVKSRIQFSREINVLSLLFSRAANSPTLSLSPRLVCPHSCFHCSNISLPASLSSSTEVRRVATTASLSFLPLYDLLLRNLNYIHHPFIPLSRDNLPPFSPKSEYDLCFACLSRVPDMIWYFACFCLNPKSDRNPTGI